MITVSYYTNKKNFVILQDPMYVRKINVFFLSPKCIIYSITSMIKGSNYIILFYIFVNSLTFWECLNAKEINENKT